MSAENQNLSRAAESTAVREPDQRITDGPASPAAQKPVAKVAKSKAATARQRMEEAIMRLGTLTKTQREAVLELKARADTFYSNDPPQEFGIPQQFNTLMIGPTGSGKTTVVEVAADFVCAGCVKCSHGSWIPAGAHESNTPTLREILHTLEHHDRVMVFVDELDKFFESHDRSNWHSSVLSDLWLLLDRKPVLKREHLAAVPSAANLEQLADMFRRRVFIVAAGTWQDLFKDRPTIGFSPNGTKEEPVECLFRRGLLPDEIRRRFHSRVITLAYPAPAEIRRMLEADEWLSAHHAECGTRPNYAELWRQVREVGLTALTSYKTELILNHVGRKRVASFRR